MGAFVLAVVDAKLTISQPDASDCLHAERGLDTEAAVIICQHEYDRTKDPATGALLAAASAVATTLLTSPARSDALTAFGHIAAREPGDPGTRHVS
jgi:hypothetical protein